MGRRAAAAVAGSAVRTRDGAAAAAGAVGGGRVGAGRGAESPRLAGDQSNWGGWTATHDQYQSRRGGGGGRNSQSNLKE